MAGRVLRSSMGMSMSMSMTMGHGMDGHSHGLEKLA